MNVLNFHIFWYAAEKVLKIYLKITECFIHKAFPNNNVNNFTGMSYK